MRKMLRHSGVSRNPEKLLLPSLDSGFRFAAPE